MAMEHFDWIMPISYRKEDIVNKLSWDWQIYLCCPECNLEHRWDPAFGAPDKSASNSKCKACGHAGLWLIRHLMHLELMCQECGKWFETSALEPSDVMCKQCSSRALTAYGMNIVPLYSSTFYEYFGSKESRWGENIYEDCNFVVQQIKGFNILPDRAYHLLVLIRFCRRLRMFCNYPGKNDEGLIFNLEGNFFRDYLRETGVAAAGFQAINAFEKSIEKTNEPIQRALVQHNVAMAAYSLLANSESDPLVLLHGFNKLRSTGVEYANHALETFVNGHGRLLPQASSQCARILYLLGDLHKTSKDEDHLRQAIDYYNRALAKNSLDERLTTFVRASRASTISSLTEPTSSECTEAIRDLEFILELDESSRAFSEKWKELYNLGVLYYVNGKSKKSLTTFEHAAALALHDYQQIMDETLLYTKGRTYVRIFEALSRGYAEMGYPHKALDALETIRAAALRKRTRTEQNQSDYNKTAATKAVHHFFDKILGDPSVLHKKPELELVSSESVIEGLARCLKNLRTVFINLTVCSSTFTALVVCPYLGRKKRISAHQWKVSKEHIMFIVKYYQAIEPSPLREQRLELLCMKIGSVLLGTVTEDLSRNSIVDVCICAPGILSNIPFEALKVSKTECLADRCRVSYVPSMGVALDLAERSLQPTLSARVLMVPYTADDLPLAREEGEAIKELTGADLTIFDYKRNSKADLLSELQGDYGFIHFCCHGDFNIITPEESCLFLTKRRVGDAEVLRACDISTLRFRNNPIVTLSACSSGISSYDTSNTFTGLAGSLLRAGARGVIGSRWPVYDDAARDFMTVLYEKMYRDRMSAKEAVNNVQSDFRGKLGIEDWAAFAYVGV